LRICFLTHYFPPERGAPQTRIHALAARLSAAGHAPVVHTGFPNYPSGRVLAPYRNRRVAVEEDPAGFRVVRSLVYPTPNAGFVRRVAGHAAFAASSLATSRRAGPVDVVVAETPPLFTAAAAVLYARAKRAPLVLNVADRWPASAVALGALRDRRAIWAAERLEAWCYRHADAVVAPTARLAQALREHPDVHRTVHVPPAVDLERFAAPVARPAGDGPLHVVYAGTVGLAQSVDTLVEAAVLAGPEVVRVTIAGDGAEAAAVAALIEARGARHVTMLGVRPAEEVAALYAGADAGAVLLQGAALLEEALPTKLMEVMAAGRPVLLAARGEAVDVVGGAGCGLAVEPHDAAGLAEAMRRLAGDAELRARLGAAGRAAAERSYSRDRAVSAWEELLVGVCAAPRRAPSP
jgi:glycosyltransferase involved in cell wall biosynthesis